MKSIFSINTENSQKNQYKSAAAAAGFTQQQITLENSPLFLPKGLENVFVGLYVIFLPYLAGITFLFIYVAKGSIDTFQSLSSESSFLFSWCIGYECLASIILLWIIKSAVSFSLKEKKGNKRFVRPRI